MQRDCLIGLIILLFTSHLEAKCGNSSIGVEGVITGFVPGVTVSLRVTPDPNWQPQPEVSIDAEGSFQATIYFDRTKSEGRRRDDCSRKPEIVTIQVRKGSAVTDHVDLNISRDFEVRNQVDYHTRSHVKLHSN